MLPIFCLIGEGFGSKRKGFYVKSCSCQLKRKHKKTFPQLRTLSHTYGMHFSPYSDTSHWMAGYIVDARYFLLWLIGLLLGSSKNRLKSMMSSDGIQPFIGRVMRDAVRSSVCSHTRDIAAFDINGGTCADIIPSEVFLSFHYDAKVILRT